MEGIENLKEENFKLREEIKFIKEQNPLQNISNMNMVPINSGLKSKILYKEFSPTQHKATDDFQITEQLITNPQMLFLSKLSPLILF